MFNYNRKIKIWWNSLFNDKSIWYRCIEDVIIKFATAINIKQTYLTTQLLIWMTESLNMSISGCFHPWRQEYLYLLHPRPKIALELWSFIHPEYSWANLYRFCHAFIFMPIWRSMFFIWFFKFSIQNQCSAMQAICLLSFLKRITYETNHF